MTAVALVRRPWFGALLVVVAASMFGMLGPVSRLAYDRGMEPLPFVVWRAAVGFAILGTLVAALARTGRATLRPRELGARGAAALVAAVVAGLLLNLAIFAAFERISVALALLGFYLYPAMVALASAALGSEPLTRRVVTALALSLAGMALVVAGGIDPSGGLALDPLGMLLALAAAAAQTVFILVSRNGFPTLTAEQAMGAALAGSVVGGLAIAVASGTAAVAALGEPFRTPELIPILLVAGSLGAAIPSLLFLRGIRRIGGTQTGILMLFEPVVGAALAALVLGETLLPIQLIGGAAILAAAYLLQGATAGPTTETTAPVV